MVNTTHIDLKIFFSDTSPVVSTLNYQVILFIFDGKHYSCQHNTFYGYFTCGFHSKQSYQLSVRGNKIVSANVDFLPYIFV